MKKFMVLVVVLMSLVSCGKKKDNSKSWLLPAELQRVWTSVNENSSQADFTDLNAVIIYGANRDGITSDCEFSVVKEVENGPYGSLYFTYVSGDTFVCSQLTGSNGYQLENNTRLGKERLMFHRLLSFE